MNIRKTLITCAALVFSLTLGWTGCAPSPSTAPAPPDLSGVKKRPPIPVAVLPERTHEFEPVPEGTPVSHDFVVRNTGEAVLYLRKISSG